MHRLEFMDLNHFSFDPQLFKSHNLVEITMTALFTAQTSKNL